MLMTHRFLLLLIRSANLDSLDRLKQLSKMDRKAELERKKAKLQALREEKEMRRKAAADRDRQNIEEGRVGIVAGEKDSKK